MGTSGSKNKGAGAAWRCAFCAFSAKPPQQVQPAPGSSSLSASAAAAQPAFICARCHGPTSDPNKAPATPGSSSGATPRGSSSASSSLNPLNSSRRAAQDGYGQLSGEAPSSSSSSSSSSLGGSGLRLPLDRVHIAPFFETLPPEHQALANSINYESEMLSLYLAEHFASLAAQFPGPGAVQLQAGMRLQIKEVDWKVLACYPPLGLVSAKTQVRCMTKPLSAIASIAKMHVLPVLASLPTRVNPQTGELESITLDPNETFRDYIRPWLAGVGEANGAALAASSSSSSSSSSSAAAAAASTPSSRSSLSRGRSFSGAQPASAASASLSSPLPAQSNTMSGSSPDVGGNSNGGSSNGGNGAGNAHMTERHIVEGELFVSRGVQFKILSCMPSNGCVTHDSVIFTNGPPIPDISKMQIHPILESLPNQQKGWTGQQFFQHYLLAYFQGRFQFVRRGDVLAIDGAEFKVVACEPDAGGLVTSDTLIFNEGPPLRAEDLRRQQLEEDEAMARHMQAQEEQAGRPVYHAHGHGRHNHGGGAQFTTPAELRARLAQVLRLMPPDDPHRAVVQRLYDQLGQMPPGAALQAADRGMIGLLRAAAGQAEANRGASQADIDALPTRIYQAPASASNGGTSSDVEKERTTCMVCLSEYEDQDELRTLPCFHSYHKDCIDAWLKRSKQCAVCKNPICA